MPNTLKRPPRPKGSNPFKAHDSAIELPDDAGPCPDCGIAVRGTTRDAIVERLVIGWKTNPDDIYDQRPIYLNLVRDVRCTARYARAVALVAKFDLERVYGNIATDLMNGALIALEIIGIDGTAASLTDDRKQTRALIDHLGRLGATATWRTLLGRGTDPSLCAPKRWAHVPRRTQTDAAAEYRRLFLLALEIPKPIPAPAGGLPGCLLCGRSAVEALPSEAAQAWTAPRQVDPRLLSPKALSRGGAVVGSLCRVCDGMVKWRALSERTVQDALVAHLGYEVREGYRLNGIPNMGAWASQRPGAEPNSRPWDHLDLDLIRRALERLRREQLVRRIGEEWPTTPLIVGWVNPRAEVTR